MTTESIRLSLRGGAPVILLLVVLTAVSYLANTRGMLSVVGLLSLLVFAVVFFTRFDLAILFVLLFRASLDFMNQYALAVYDVGAAQRLNFFSVFSVVFVLLYSLRTFFRIEILRFARPVWPYFAFLGVAFIGGVLFAIDRVLFAVDWLKYLTSGMMMMAIMEICNEKKDLWKVCVVLALSSIAPVVVALYQALTGVGGVEISKWNFGVFESTYRSVVGTFEQSPHQFGFYLGVLLPITIFVILQSDARTRALSFFYPVLMAMCVYLTYIKSVLGILVAQGLTYAFFRRSLVVILIVIVALGAIFVYDPTLQSRIAEDLLAAQLGQEERLFTGRVQIWSTILLDYSTQPLLVQLFGVGLRSTAWLIGAKIGWMLGPHSEVIHFLYETGALGLAFFSLFYLRLLGKCFRLKNSGESEFYRQLGFWGLVTFIGVLPHLVGDNPFTGLGSVWYFFAVAGLIEAAFRLGVEGRQ